MKTKQLLGCFILLTLTCAQVYAEAQSTFNCANSAAASAKILMEFNHEMSEDEYLKTDLQFIRKDEDEYVWEAYRYVEVAPEKKQSESPTYQMTLFISPFGNSTTCYLSKYEMKSFK